MKELKRYLVVCWDVRKSADTLEEAKKLKEELESKYGWKYKKRAHIYELIE